MAAPQTPPDAKRRERQALRLVESAGADHDATADSSAPGMAVSIAGVSTACSKDALVSSAKAVAKSLAPE